MMERMYTWRHRQARWMMIKTKDSSVHLHSYSYLSKTRPTCGYFVYIMQHDICHAGYCNITIKDVMEFTMGNISYDYSKQTSFLDLMEKAESEGGYGQTWGLEER